MIGIDTNPEGNKPTTTGEWNIAANSCADQTAAQIEFLKGRVIDLEQQLATDRENYQRTVTDFLKCNAVETEEGVKMLAQRSFELHECQKQLAAEREKWMKLCDKASDNATRAEQALDGEIKSHERTEGSLRLFAASAGTLRKQLAAEREKQRLIKLDNFNLRRELDDAIRRSSNTAVERDKIVEQLAAEREAHERATEAHGRALRELDKQLAAEREKAEALQEQVNIRGEMRDEAIAEMTEALKQLAAEREVGHNTAVALGQQIIKLEDQLGAEREKNK